MAKKEFIVSPELYDLDHPIAGLEEIRRYNRQRYEMEQLTAIVYENRENYSCVGYKDVRADEFWVRGHMPGAPLLPGILFCEAAAQMASFFIGKYNMMGGGIMGFAGLDEVKFRGMVRPGDRLVIQAKLLKLHKLLITAQFMAIVGDNIVSEGIIKGFPMTEEQLNQGLSK